MSASGIVLVSHVPTPPRSHGRGGSPASIGGRLYPGPTLGAVVVADGAAVAEGRGVALGCAPGVALGRAVGFDVGLGVALVVAAGVGVAGTLTVNVAAAVPASQATWYVAHA
ncbi:MAG TPA: hypothetical protein VFI15_01655, partial [Candidatus Limnocylindrales bacterium]|nr:hypothetical protein [Candidatus Limnocylindrales bacterium]